MKKRLFRKRENYFVPSVEVVVVADFLLLLDVLLPLAPLPSLQQSFDLLMSHFAASLSVHSFASFDAVDLSIVQHAAFASFEALFVSLPPAKPAAESVMLSRNNPTTVKTENFFIAYP